MAKNRSLTNLGNQMKKKIVKNKKAMRKWGKKKNGRKSKKKNFLIMKNRQKKSEKSRKCGVKNDSGSEKWLYCKNIDKKIEKMAEKCKN